MTRQSDSLQKASNHTAPKSLQPALAFLAILFGSSLSTAQTRSEILPQSMNNPAGYNQVLLTITVANNRGEYVTGLNKEYFTISANKNPLQITYFAQQDLPLCIGIILDLSGSIRESTGMLGTRKINAIREGLSHFMRMSNKANEYFLIAFNKTPELLVDNTRDSDAILARMTSLELKSLTALYDACYLGLEKVVRGNHSKRAIILISDGVDSASRRKRGELERLLKETDVLVYSISVMRVGERRLEYYDGPQAMMGNPVLEQLSRISGGVAFFPTNPTEVRADFEMIATELRNQYTIGFRPVISGAGDKWQPIEVKVRGAANSLAELQRLSVRSRRGFYPLVGLR